MTEQIVVMFPTIFRPRMRLGARGLIVSISTSRSWVIVVMLLQRQTKNPPEFEYGVRP